MMSWSTFWLGLVTVSMASFAALSLYVMVGGFRDVLAMFHRIDQQHERGNAESRTGNDEG